MFSVIYVYRIFISFIPPVLTLLIRSLIFKLILLTRTLCNVSFVNILIYSYEISHVLTISLDLEL